MGLWVNSGHAGVRDAGVTTGNKRGSMKCGTRLRRLCVDLSLIQTTY